MYKIIKNYISKISLTDINDFALKNRIILNNKELNCIHKCLKENLDELINNSDKVFNDNKTNFSSENFNKIYDLFMEYKKRYKNYL